MQRSSRQSSIADLDVVVMVRKTDFGIGRLQSKSWVPGHLRQEALAPVRPRREGEAASRFGGLLEARVWNEDDVGGVADDGWVGLVLRLLDVRVVICGKIIQGILTEGEGSVRWTSSLW